MTKIAFTSVSFILPGKKKSSRFRRVRKPAADQKPWKAKRAAAIWFALFCAYGSATATMQYEWNAGLEILKGAFFQGAGAGLMAAAIAALVCVAHNRNEGRNAK